MPQKRLHPCWKNKGEPFGYIENHRGMARLRMGSVRRSLGMGFIPANKASALAILKEMQGQQRAARMAGTLGIAVGTPAPETRSGFTGRPTTLFQAMSAFQDGPYQHLERERQRSYDSAFGYFCVRDCPLDYDLLRLLLQQRFDARMSLPNKRRPNGGPIAHNTLFRYRADLSLFFRDFVIRNGWMPSDPTATLGRIARETGTNLDRPTEEEMARIVADLAEHATVSVSSYVRLLSITAMRPMEAIELMWWQVSDAGITVIGKGGLPKIRGKGEAERRELIRRRAVRYRRIPIAAIPGLRETLEEVRREIAPGQGRGRLIHGPEYVFRWHDATSIRMAFSATIKRLGLRPTLTISTLRNFALWWWENRLGFGEAEYEDMSGARRKQQSEQPGEENIPISRLTMAGHSRRVNRMHYRDVPTAEELAERIARNKGR